MTRTRIVTWGIGLVLLAGCSSPAEQPIVIGHTQDSGAETAADASPDSAECLDSDGDGYTTCAGDCDDVDPYAYPGSSHTRSWPRIGAGGYDYDCDGKETPSVPGKALQCGGDAGSNCELCAYHQGYWSESEPACGASGVWVVSCGSGDGGSGDGGGDGGTESGAESDGSACSCIVEVRKQSCH